MKVFCPFCGSHSSVHTEVAFWPAYSSEDAKNEALLAEAQCTADGCEGGSFWLAVDTLSLSEPPGGVSRVDSNDGD